MEKRIPIYWTIIGGIIIAVVLGITPFLCSKIDVVQYIGFAATITSLVLAVIAIFYSIITNTRSSENIGELKGAAREIFEGAKTVTNVADRINNSLHSIEVISHSINEQFNLLPLHFQKVDSGVRELKELYETNMRNSITTEKRGITESPKIDLSEEFVRNYLDRCSFSGLLCMYAAVLAKRKGIDLDIQKLNEVTRIDSSWPSHYFYGFLIACFCADVVITDANSDGSFRIIKINTIVERDIENEVENRAREVDSIPANKSNWTKSIFEMEALYK